MRSGPGVFAALMLLAVIAACGKATAPEPVAPPVAEAAQSVPMPVAGDTRSQLVTDWDFWRADAGQKAGIADVPPTGWQPVTLPHTANIEPRIVNDQWQGDAFYRHVFRPEPDWAGKSVWLRFEGAMNVAEVFVNGARVERHLGGYLPFTVDLTSAASSGEPVEVIVHLDNRDNPVTGPKPLKILDFNMYGGLYREVTLSVRDTLHITDETEAAKPAEGGIFVTYPSVTEHEATIEVQTEVRNAGAEPRFFTVRQKLLRDGTVVDVVQSIEQQFAPGKTQSIPVKLTVDAPALWAPDSPNLYTLVSEIVDGGRVADSRETRIGIREIDISRTSFRINGRKMYLRGVNRHQEYPYVGYAIPPNADYRDAKLIKEAGFDYVRLSHYPPSPHFMDAADELGLLLLDAIPGWQYSSDDPAFVAQVERTCRDMIRRDRNHPSVLAWECSLNESDMSPDLVKRLHTAVHEEYPGPQAWSAGWVPETYDIYLQARQHRLPHPDQVLPNKPYIVSEYGDWEYYAQNAGLAQDSWQNLSEAERTSRQLLSDGEARLLQQALNIQEAANDNRTTRAFADGYWAMFDYNRGYADDLEASGVASLERVTKPSYQFFRSQRDAGETSPHWNGGPMVFIASDWAPGSSLDVRVFSNAEEVTLSHDGKEFARQTPDDGPFTEHLAHPPFTFHLPKFEPGELVASAYIGGQIVARHSVRTPEAPASVVAGLAREGDPAVAGDLLFVHARVVDANGTTVPDNGIEVDLSLEPGLEAVGPVRVPTEHGIAATLVRVVDPGQAGVTGRIVPEEE